MFINYHVSGGGGFAPPTFALLAIVVAIGINKPFLWLRTHISNRLIEVLAKLRKFAFIPFIVFASFAIVVAIFGYPLLWFFSADVTLNILSTLGHITFFGLGPIVIFTSLAYDIQN